MLLASFHLTVVLLMLALFSKSFRVGKSLSSADPNSVIPIRKNISLLQWPLVNPMRTSSLAFSGLHELIDKILDWVNLSSQSG